MRSRCYYKGNSRFHSHDDRGIVVCDRWLNSFENFLDDMGPKPSPKHSIDRINNDGNYEPANCRWATTKEQMRNRRGNAYFSHGGLTMILNDWATKCGINRSALAQRIYCLKWTFERAITTPLRR